ncbi:MAG: TIGR01212 family radical SAM protein [Muribaculaceae bacterium]|nr:TIGR01212 family radical SAM protein [Muribaculaceae bacterium]
MDRISYSDFLRQLYGYKVQKLNVNAGFTCPNRDGTKGLGGCIYCNNASFTPAFGCASSSVAQQLLDAKQFYAGKYPDMKYLAYFQSFTNTYAPVEKLRELYYEALAFDDIIGLVISTRPDCVGDEVLDLLQSINEEYKVIVEIGVETSHDSTLELINRCHSWQCIQSTINRLEQRGLTVGAHLILGLPGESENDMMATVDAIAKLPVSSLKFHQLQVLRGTQLAQWWERGEVQIKKWTAQEYAQLCYRIINRLPERIVVERMVSTAPAHLLIHPKWNLKPAEFKKIFEKIV